jgi:transposase
LLHRQTHPDDIARLQQVGVATVFNVKSRYCEGGSERALFDLPRSGKPARITLENKAAITALACTNAPAGYARWNLRL